MCRLQGRADLLRIRDGANRRQILTFVRMTNCARDREKRGAASNQVPTSMGMKFAAPLFYLAVLNRHPGELL